MIFDTFIFAPNVLHSRIEIIEMYFGILAAFILFFALFTMRFIIYKLAEKSKRNAQASKRNKNFLS